MSDGLGAEAPAFERHGDECTLRWNDHQVEMSFAGIRDAGEGLHGELVVRHRGHEVHWGRLNLVSARTRDGVASTLKRFKDEDGDEIPWQEMLERACRTTALAIRRAAPAIALRPRLSTGPRHLIEPLLPLAEPAVLFGDGGAGKGYIAATLALAAMSGAALPAGLKTTRRAQTMYLDWEATPEELEERLYLLGQGLGCSGEGLHYRRMTRALADEAQPVRAEISQLGIGLVIVDSLGPACGAEPEGADAAVRAFTALRSFGTVTCLVIAHVSKIGADQRQGAARPYGSVFVQNLARSVWEIRRSDEEERDLVVGLYHRKANRGRLCQPIALRFAFEPDRITVRGADLAEGPDLLARASLPQRIKTMLATGALTDAELAEALDAPESSVRRTMERMRRKGGSVLTLPDTKPRKWGLASHV